MRRFFQLDGMLLIACLLALPIIVQTSLLDGRLPGTDDAFLHLQRLVSAALNWHEGVIWGRWGPHLHAGYGYPLGNFYAPGWHVIGGFFVMLGIPAVTVWLFAQTLALLLYPVGGYLFARLYAGKPAALAAAAALTYIPLNFYSVFSQGNISQLMAMSLIAWVLWGFGKCRLSPSPARIVIAGMLFAALIATHHPTAFIAAPVAGLYVLMISALACNVGTDPRVCPANQSTDSDDQGNRKKDKHIGLSLQRYAPFAAYALGLLLSAIYWLPAALEADYVSLDAAATQYQFREEFLRFPDLLGGIHRIDLTALNHPHSLSIGLVQRTFLAVSAFLIMISRRQTRWQRAHWYFGAAFIALAIYMMQYRSLWLWQTLPGAELILYPHRLLGIVAVGIAPAAAITIEQIPVRWRSISALFMISVTMGTTLPQLYPYKIDFPDLGTVTPLSSLEYEMETRNYGGVATNEYTPRWAEVPPTEPPACLDCYRKWEWRVYANTPSDNAVIETSDGQHRTGTQFQVESPVGWQLELHQMYFPGWRAELDGEPVEISITESHGLMAVEVPAGKHRLEVWYAGTTAQHIGTWISLLALLGCVGVIVFSRVRYVLGAEYDEADSINAVPTTSLAVGTRFIASEVQQQQWFPLAVVIIIMLFAGLLKTNNNTLQFHSDLENPASMRHESHLIFYDEQGTPTLELLGYTISDTEAEYGEWVYIDLYWRALRDLETDYRVNVTLLFPEIELGRTSSDNFAPGTFPTSTWPLDKYIIDTHILRMDATVAPGEGALVALVYSGELKLQDAEGRTLVPFSRLDVIQSSPE